MSEMHHDPLIDHDLVSLPADVKPLVDWLAADGVTWRASLPSTSALDAAVHTLSRGVVEPIDSIEQAPVLDDLPSQPVPSLAAVARGRTGSVRVPVRLAGLASVAAMVAVVTLIVGVFALQAPGVHRGRTVAGPRATATPSPDTAWTDQSQLDVVTVSDVARNQYPVVAPSDPRVVYEAYIQYTDQAKHNAQVVLRRSDDAGATWHTLPNPVPGDTGVEPLITQVVFIVSPLDAHTVILQMNLPPPMHQSFSCPAPFAQYVHYQAPCQPQYRSTDGGATWVPLVTPDYGVPQQTLMGLRPPAMPYLQGDEAAALHAQGARLYSAIYGSDSSCVRIVASEDGGATWHTADDGLAAQGIQIEDYAASPTGNTVFAVTSPGNVRCYSAATLTLWRSDDVGATWHRVGQLPTPFDDGLVTVATTDPAQPLLYLNAPRITGYTVDRVTGERYPYSSYLADDLKASTDGGHTWQSAPTAGIPTRLRTYPGLLGTLSDGSIVVACVPDFGAMAVPWNPFGVGTNASVTLYAWKLGAPTWRQLTPALEQGLNSLVITTAGDQDTLWVTNTTFHTTPQPKGTFYEPPTHYHILRFRLP